VKILFDHNVPYGLRLGLTSHTVWLADEMGWAEVSNGELLRAAEAAGFEVMVTCDQSISYQQNLRGRTLALVVLDTNNWQTIKKQPLVIAAAVDRATPGSFELLSLRV